MSRSEKAKALELGIEASKLGLSVEDLEPMLKSWYITRYRFIKLRQQIEDYEKEFSQNE